MNESVIVEDLIDLPFEKHYLISAEFNISVLSSLSPDQLITLKAKVVNLQKATTVSIGGSKLSKADALLIDQHGSIKIFLLENNIETVREGQTYFFKKLCLKKKNKYPGDLYVNPVRANSSITVADSFPEDKLFVPQEIPKELITSEMIDKVTGVNKVNLQTCCYKCHKIIPIDLSSPPPLHAPITI